MVTFRQTECRQVATGVLVGAGGGESVRTLSQNTVSGDRVSVPKMKHLVDSHSHEGSRILRVLSTPPMTTQVDFSFCVFRPF